MYQSEHIFKMFLHDCTSTAVAFVTLLSINVHSMWCMRPSLAAGMRSTPQFWEVTANVWRNWDDTHCHPSEREKKNSDNDSTTPKIYQPKHPEKSNQFFPSSSPPLQATNKTSNNTIVTTEGSSLKDSLFGTLRHHLRPRLSTCRHRLCRACHGAYRGNN